MTGPFINGDVKIGCTFINWVFSKFCCPNYIMKRHEESNDEGRRGSSGTLSIISTFIEIIINTLIKISKTFKFSSKLKANVIVLTIFP